jgi:hypothetical protein
MIEDSAEMMALASSRGVKLAKHAGLHVLIWLLTFGLFAATDSWFTLTGLGLASFLCILTGIIAGLTTTTLIHEWCHYLGARFSGAVYDIPAKPGLFVFDWDFSRNGMRQFYIMSVAGNAGGALGVLLLWSWVPADTWGRAALLGGGVAGFIYGAAVEWPVLRRSRTSADPLAELSKIDQGVLLRSLVISVLAGGAVTLMAV